MQPEIVTYEADGLSMQSVLYTGASQSRKQPGILVFPEAFGLGAHAKSRAERLAGLGYIALACDYYGGGKTFNSMEPVMAELGPLTADPLRIRARAKGGLDALLARPEIDPSRIAAIGYCFGGTMSLELARAGSNIAGVMGFHSGLQTTRPQDAKNIKTKILVCIGADDPMIPAEQRHAFEAEMREGKVDWQMKLYGGAVHSFTNPDAGVAGLPDAIRYDAKADARSWTDMQEFFSEIFV